MQLPEKFKEYAALVCEQLRWKRARPVIQREIETHLCDQYDALVKSGLPEEAAVDESIRQMGDAVEIGTGLDRVHRPKPSWGLLILTGVLLLMGLGIRLFVPYDGDYHPNDLFPQLLASVLGVGCLFGAYFADFTILGKRPWLIYVGVVVLMGCGVWYTQRVLDYAIPYYSVQLSLLLPTAFAALLYKLRGKGYIGLLISFAALAFAMTCCVILPSMTATLIVMVCGVTVMAVALWGDWFQIGKTRGCVILGAFVVLVAAVLVWRISSSAYMLSRLTTAFHPELDPDGRGWAGMLIRKALASAELFGTGDLGEYHNRLLFLQQSELQLTYLIHRVGWMSLVVIMAVFAAFFVVAVHKCIKQKNMLGRMVSLAVILTLATQVAIYVVYDLGICLIEGISLPLVSYANVALIANMALIGIMLSVFRTGSLVRDEALPGRSKSTWKDRVRWSDGELTISFKKKIVS